MTRDIYNGIHAAEKAILQAFGLEDGQNNITELHLHCKGGETPMLEVRRLVWQAPDFGHTFETREVVNIKPTEPAPFDLDALCTRARMRLHNAIDHATRDAKHHIARGFLDARLACGLQLRGRDKRYMTDDEVDMFYEFHLISGIETGLAFKRQFDTYRFSTESTPA